MENTIIVNDSQLITQCIAGNRQAQYRLYTRYAGAMLNVAYRILGNREDAKDVLQESFVKIFRELKNLKNPRRLTGWIKRIVINTSINHGKRRGVKFVELDRHVPRIFEEEIGHIDLKIDEVKNAMMQLPDGYRTVLTLYLIDGYDHEEISQILNISKSGSLTQYSRGKKRLLKILKSNRHGQT